MSRYSKKEKSNNGLLFIIAILIVVILFGAFSTDIDLPSLGGNNSPGISEDVSNDNSSDSETSDSDTSSPGTSDDSSGSNEEYVPVESIILETYQIIF